MTDRKYLLLLYEHGEDNPKVLGCYSREADLWVDLPKMANLYAGEIGLGIAILKSQVLMKSRTVVDLEEIKV